MPSVAGRLTVLVAVVGVLGGCATHSGATALVVRQNGAVLAHVGMSRLKELPQLEIHTPQSHGAQVQRGPSVTSVLADAGATGVTAVRVEGRDPAQTLTAAQLSERVILNLTRRNTLKLVGSDLDTDRWVRDVTALVVNP